MMLELTAHEVCEAVGGTLISGRDWGIISGVSIDSRSIKKGELFVPIIGERYDGHDFIQSAIDRQAACVLTQRQLNVSFDIPVIAVDDTARALKDLAAYYRNQFHTIFVAVTGSTGKTTCKEMVYSVLSQRYFTFKNEGNLNNQIGVPLSMFKLCTRHQYGVVEMGMSGFGEIHDLSAIVRPHIGVITNIGLSHIEKLGSQDNIFKAKLELFDCMDTDCVAVLNGDDRMLAGLQNVLPCRVEYFSTKNNGRIKVLNIRKTTVGCYEYDLKVNGLTTHISLNVPGFHNIYNSLAAAQVGLEAGLGPDEIKSGIEAFAPADMRLNTMQLNDGITLIDDSYNASPDSMRSAIDVLMDMEGDRKIAVLADMLELGDVTEQAHRVVGEYAAGKGVDYLLAIGPAAAYMAFQAKQSGMDDEHARIFNCNKDLIDFLRDFLQKGDTILVKGSRAMKTEEICTYIREERNILP